MPRENHAAFLGNTSSPDAQAECSAKITPILYALTLMWVSAESSRLIWRQPLGFGSAEWYFASMPDLMEKAEGRCLPLSTQELVRKTAGIGIGRLKADFLRYSI